jgi:VanZ family protein
MALLGSYTLSVLPGDIVAPLFRWSDKLNHTGAFIVLAFLLRMGWRIDYWRTFVLLAAYGGFIEISQLFAIHRSAQWTDLGADIIGIFLGLKLHKYFRRIFD